jgi:hypothetical protein
MDIAAPRTHMLFIRKTLPLQAMRLLTRSPSASQQLAMDTKDNLDRMEKKQALWLGHWGIPKSYLHTRDILIKLLPPRPPLLRYRKKP